MKPRLLLNVLLSVVVLALAASAGYWLFTHRRQPAERQPVRLVPKILAPPLRARRDQRVEIVAYGSARPRVQLDVTPEVTGTVVAKAANFFSGKYVRRGQELFRIDHTDYDLSVQAVEKRIELLNAQLSRLNQEEKNLQESMRIEIQRRDLADETVRDLTELLSRNAASDTEVDAARETLLARAAQVQTIANQLALIPQQRAQLVAERATAEVELKQAKKNLARCTVHSPVTGRVLQCGIEVGERVVAGSSCGQLYGTDRMEVPVSIPATDLNWIEEERLEACRRQATPDPNGRIPADVQWQRPGNGPTIRWNGCVERVEAGLEAETRTASLVVCVRNPALRGVAGWPSTTGPPMTNPSTEPGGDGASTSAGSDPTSAGNDVPSPNEDKAMLEVNMFCKVTVWGKQLAVSYLVPRRAILPDSSVFVVVDGRLGKRQVSVARFTSEEAMILPGGGLQEGDRVVIDTIAKPVLGMAVEAIDVRPGDAPRAPDDQED